jgi:hypothetical protein
MTSFKNMTYFITFRTCKCRFNCKSEKGIGKYRFEGIKNYEGKNGTICRANNGKDSANSGIGS